MRSSVQRAEALQRLESPLEWTTGHQGWKGNQGGNEMGVTGSYGRWASNSVHREMAHNTVGPRPTAGVRCYGSTRPDVRQKRATDADKS